MYRVIILGDTHFGAKKSSKIIFDHQEKFFNWFFERVDALGIKHIIQLGDMFDTHSTVNLNASVMAKELLVSKIASRPKTYLHTLIGNHDIASRRSILVNAQTEILGEYSDCVKVYSEPAETPFGLMVPWICDENRELVNRMVAESKSRYCFGHFEFKDFYMYKGLKNEHGQDDSEYSKFNHVLSGHYHHRNKSNNVTYVGTPYQLSFAESDEVKGFHILDLKSGDLEFIESPYHLFSKIYLESDDSATQFNDLIIRTEGNTVREKYLKLYVSGDVKEKTLDQITDKINSFGVHNLEVITSIDSIVTDLDQINLETVELKDTTSILDMYVDSLDDKIDKSNVRGILYSLYTEAINMEE